MADMKRIIVLYIAWLIAAGLLVSAAVEKHPYKLLHTPALNLLPCFRLFGDLGV